MPTGPGEYRPGDIVEAATIYNAVAQDPELSERVQINLQSAGEQLNDIDVSELSRRDWPTNNAFRLISRSLMPDDPDFEQPFAELPATHWPYRKLYERAQSPMEWALTRRDVEQKITDDKMFRKMGVSEWAQYMAWQMADPISVALAISTGSIFTIGRGLTVGQAAARTAGLAAAESAAIEAVLQISDPLRTIDESILSTMAGGAFGAFLGGGGQRVYNLFRGKSPEPLQKEIHGLFRDEVEITRAENRLAMEAGSQDSVTPARLAEDELPNDIDEVSDAIDEYTQVFDSKDPAAVPTDPTGERVRASVLAPLVRNKLLRSAQTIMLYDRTAPAFSRLSDMFSSNNIIKRGDYTGTRYNGKTLAQEIKIAERQMLKKAIDETTLARKALRKLSVRMSEDEVARRIGMAARRVGRETDELEPIKQAGARVREIFDDWKERGLRTKVLSREAVEQMDNYVARLWDMEEVARNPLVFRTKIESWLRNKHPDLDADETRQALRDIKHSLLRINDGESHPVEFHIKRTDPKTGHAKARRLTMPDEVIEEFLVSDVRILLDRYTRGVGADIIVREIFGADNITTINGLPMPKAQYQAGIRQYDEAIEALENKGTKAALRKAAKLRNRQELAAKAAESFLRQILNRPNTPNGALQSVIDESARQLRGYAGASQLGMVVASAFPDPANNVLQHGMANLLLSLPEFFKTLPAVFSRAPVTARRAAQFREFDIALDNIINTRMMDIAHVENMGTYGVKRGFLHGTEVARKAFRIFLADRWNTMVKLLAATVAETAIVRAAPRMAAGKLGKQRMAKMRRIGMDEATAKRIAENVKQHGKTKGLLNYDQWDRAAYDDMRGLLWRESEFQVVAPDAGELPELFNSEVGKLFMQYKTFIISHTMKQMIPATQRFQMGDMSVLAGMTAMVSLGIFSEYVKDMLKSWDDGGFDTDKVNDEWADKTAMDLVGMGINNSGLLSYLPGLMGQLDNFFNNELGEAVGMTPRARTYSPGGLENQAAGLGYAYDVGAAGWAAAQGATGQKEYTAKDLRKIRRVTWLQNTFYLNWLFDWGEQTIVDEADLPEKAGQSSSVR